jgi:16S rRNA (guanine527-N7)-methyltransferase
MPSGIELLERGLDNWKIPSDNRQLQLFEKYYSILFNWNQKMNLTAIEALDDVMVFHFLDSLTPLLTNKIGSQAKVIDVGSGGGFPGIPIKIMRPDIEMVLVDSSNKKVAFLNELIDALSLDNTYALHKRAEQLGHEKGFRESFAVVLSRAVAQLNVLCEYCLPLNELGGTFLAHKGPGAEDEMNLAQNAIKILGGSKPEIFKADILGSQKRHYLVMIEKSAKTPKKYPRTPGKPEKSPL